jgi:hypothetical protein
MEQALRRNAPNKPLAMLCNEAKFINNLANRVQDKYPSKNAGVTVESLQDAFMWGKRIDILDLREKARKSRSAFMMEKYEYEV